MLPIFSLLLGNSFEVLAKRHRSQFRIFILNQYLKYIVNNTVLFRNWLVISLPNELSFSCLWPHVFTFFFKIIIYSKR